jgi:hypothetical protein
MRTFKDNTKILVHISFAINLLAVGMAYPQNEVLDKNELEKAGRQLVRNILTTDYSEELCRVAGDQAALSFEVSIQSSLKRPLTDSEKQRMRFFWYKKMKTFANPDTLDQMFIPTLIKYFTLDELREVNQFYDTPTGKKLTKLNPILSREMQSVGENIGAKVADKKWQATVLEELKSEFPQWYPAPK